MKRIIRFLLLLSLTLSLVFSLVGCSFLSSVAEGGGVNVNVTFVTPQESKTVKVPLGKTVSPPKNPTLENQIFCGWYTDEACKVEYDFSSAVMRDTTLYAGFVLDGAKITNEITLSVMPALVTVENVYRQGVRDVTSQGSGFIYKLSGGRAFVLTNCHVAYSPTALQSIRVKDFRGEQHEATVYRKAFTSPAAIDSEYDLAILVFTYSGEELKVLPFSDADISKGEAVISLGSPENQSHAITFGEVLGYRNVMLSESAPEESNVTFEIIYHSAMIKNGSSGGPLLDKDLAVVGVNFAGTAPEEGESFGKGCAVPLSKVQEFLSRYE